LDGCSDEQLLTIFYFLVRSAQRSKQAIDLLQQRAEEKE